MMVVGLLASLIASASACLAPMRLSPSTLESLTLGEGAGVVEADAIERAELLGRASRGELTPEAALAKIDARTPRFASTTPDGDPTSLTNAQLDELRQKDALRYLHVREFDFTRWPLWWAFVLGATSLGVGAMVVRDGTRRTLALRAEAQGRAGVTSGAPPRAGTFLPLQAACALRDGLARARRDAAARDCPVERMSALAAGLAGLLGRECAAFRRRGRLVQAQVGNAAWSRVSGRFGQVERTLQRARAAAEDGDAPGAESAASRAAELAETFEEELGLLRMRLGG
jgi:hypothetical protein